MKNDTTFVRMRSGDHLGDAKMSKKGTSLRRIYFFINCNGHKRFSQNERRRADQQKLPKIFQFLPGDLVMIFQSFVMILPRFFNFERPYLSPWAKIKNSEAIFCSHEHDEQVCQVS